MLAGVGVIVLVVALIALRDPSRNGTSPASPTRTVTETVSGAPQTSPRSTPKSTPRSTPASTSRTSSSSSSPAGLVGALPLVVLNNTGRTNLATDAGDQFKVGGWTVTSVDENYSNNIRSTAAYYDPSVSNAKAVAEALQTQFPQIERVVPKFSPLPDGPIVVILTGGLLDELTPRPAVR